MAFRHRLSLPAASGLQATSLRHGPHTSRTGTQRHDLPSCRASALTSAGRLSSRTPPTKGADVWTVTLPPSRRPWSRLPSHAPAPSIPTLGRSVMILKKPQQARRVASGVTVHDLNLIPSVPRTHNGFLLFRARPHDPGSQAAFGRPLPSFCCRPHPAR